MSKYNLRSDSVSAISLIKLFFLFYYPTYEILQSILRLEVDFHCGEILTGVSKIEVKYENVIVEQGSPLIKFSRDLASIHYVYFIYARKIYLRIHVLITRQ